MEGRPRETNSKRRRRVSVSVKAALDRTLAAVLLVILGPLILLIALAIRITMGGPVLFRQERLGRDERIFTIKKFRTMDQRPGLPDVERLTPLGRFLRRTSLDELPQLLNIVEGGLSFVGPRPLLVRYGPFLHRRGTPPARGHARPHRLGPDSRTQPSALERAAGLRRLVRRPLVVAAGRADCLADRQLRARQPRCRTRAEREHGRSRCRARPWRFGVRAPL